MAIVLPTVNLCGKSIMPTIVLNNTMVGRYFNYLNTIVNLLDILDLLVEYLFLLFKNSLLNFILCLCYGFTTQSTPRLVWSKEGDVTILLFMFLFITTNFTL